MKKTAKSFHHFFSRLPTITVFVQVTQVVASITNTQNVTTIMLYQSKDEIKIPTDLFDWSFAQFSFFDFDLSFFCCILIDFSY